MKLRIVEIDGTVEELDSSTAVAELLAGRADAFETTSTDAVPAHVVDADDATADVADNEPAGAARSPDGIPGVAEEGQETVRRLLDGNPAGDLFVRFLETTTSWPNVRLHGIKRKSDRQGDPLDYSRYLRLRKQGSQLGGFAYVYAVDGTVNLRLRYSSDEELADIAPDAWRLHAGHREYRVSIRITDDRTLKQALQLARLAYDAT